MEGAPSARTGACGPAATTTNAPTSARRTAALKALKDKLMTISMPFPPA
jgi:hypothetical protein